MTVLCVVLGIAYAACNLVTAKIMSAKEMAEDFIKDQCLVGRICANIFYAPAWFLKGLRAAILFMVK